MSDIRGRSAFGPGHASAIMARPARTVPPVPESTRRDAFLTGVRLLLPMLVGVAPFGAIYGVVALQSGIAPLQAMLMSSVLFAGASQFLLAQMVGAGAPGLVTLGAVALINARHALYSASLAPLLAPLPRRWKLLLAYLLTDEAYAAAIGTLMRRPQPAHAHWVLFGSGFALWAGWQVSTALGILLGQQLPDGLELDFALPLTFIAIVVPMVTTRAHGLAAAVAGASALALHDLPYRGGFVVAAAAGLAVAVLADRRRPGAA